MDPTNWNELLMTSDTGLLVKGIWNRLVAAIRRNSLVNGVNYKVSQTSEGTTLDINFRAIAGADPYPFELLDASTTEGETITKKFRVRLGFLAGLLPAEMVPGDDPQCIFDYEGEMMDVWGAVDVDEFNNFTAASITAEAHSGSKPNTATTVYILIGQVWFDGDTFRKSQSVTSEVYPLCMYSVGSDVLGASWTRV